MSPTQEKTVCVLGLGYIGLPTAAVLASRGYAVRGVDVSQDVVATVNAGETHIVEPDLEILVRAAVQTGRLRAHTEPDESDVFLVCVPTPLNAQREPEMRYVREATASICPYLRRGNLVVLESTSPPGTTEELAAIIEERTGIARGEYALAHAPERVLPGRILREVVDNDRIIGGVDERSAEQCREFYGTFVSGGVHVTQARTAEMVKLVENAFRDVNIAFANELSLLADRFDVDVWEIIRLANRHPRVDILRPGPGVGGHCIAVDPWFLVHAAPEETRLIHTARSVNERKPSWVVERVRRRAERFRDARVACLGLAYKPDIDDLRESPSIEIVRALRDAGIGQLRVVEPNLAAHPEFELTDLDEALRDADIVLFLVAHRQFRMIPANRLAEKTIIDVCGALQE